MKEIWVVVEIPDTHDLDLMGEDAIRVLGAYSDETVAKLIVENNPKATLRRVNLDTRFLVS